MTQTRSEQPSLTRGTLLAFKHDASWHSQHRSQLAGKTYRRITALPRSTHGTSVRRVGHPCLESKVPVVASALGDGERSLSVLETNRLTLSRSGAPREGDGSRLPRQDTCCPPGPEQLRVRDPARLARGWVEAMDEAGEEDGIGPQAVPA